jgi:hypothetical protein
MQLQVIPNGDTGLWEIHDECGHLCNLESQSTAYELVKAHNMLPKLVDALEWAMEKTSPSPCRCLPFAKPPHVCVAHRVLAEANNPEVIE